MRPADRRLVHAEGPRNFGLRLALRQPFEGFGDPEIFVCLLDPGDHRKPKMFVQFLAEKVT